MKAVFDIKPAKVNAPTMRGDTLFLAQFFIVAAVIIGPLAVIDIPPLTGYPNHVARMHVIGNVDQSFFLRDRYDISFDLIPNIAMDLVVPWLVGRIPLDVAARLFVAVWLLMILTGVARLHQALFNL